MADYSKDGPYYDFDDEYKKDGIAPSPGLESRDQLDTILESGSSPDMVGRGESV